MVLTRISHLKHIPYEQDQLEVFSKRKENIQLSFIFTFEFLKNRLHHFTWNACFRTEVNKLG